MGHKIFTRCVQRRLSNSSILSKKAYVINNCSTSRQINAFSIDEMGANTRFLVNLQLVALMNIKIVFCT